MNDEKLFDVLAEIRERLASIEADHKKLPDAIKSAISEHAMACPQKGSWKPADTIKLVTLVLGSGGLGAGVLKVVEMLAGA